MGQIVLAYHGCDITIRDGLVRRVIEPKISNNPYDWLGKGLYFFEGDFLRAKKLAQNSHERNLQLLTRQPIGTPAVVGAILDIDRWFDLTTQTGIFDFTRAASALVAGSAGGEMPRNKQAFPDDEDFIHRAFDRAACEMVHKYRELTHKKALEDHDSAAIVASAPYQASRGAYEQGVHIADGSSVRGDTHIQIAVHDLNCIRGWFLVPGDKLLDSQEWDEAAKAMAKVKAERTVAKPRRASR